MPITYGHRGGARPLGLAPGMNLDTFNWRPTIGDPTWVGWITVLAYVAGAALALRAAAVRPHTDPSNSRTIWMVVAVAMGALGLNKQLDLQTLFMEVGRVTARSQGWYEQRRVFQMWFVAGCMLGSGLLFTWFTWRFRSFWAAHRLLILGLLVLITFVVVRAVSFHHFDVLLRNEILGVRVHRLLELVGVSLVIAAALLELLARGRQTSGRSG